MVSYTNRKGITYYLHRGTGPTGKVRYFFSLKQESDKGESVEEIPAGYAVGESVNGVVSLARERPSPLRPEEVETVQEAVRRHPKARDYRVVARGRQILVYEYAGPDAEDLAAELSGLGLGSRITAESLRASFERHARYAPVLRFTLAPGQPTASPRAFQVERWSYRGRIDGWLDLHIPGDLVQLVRRTVPALGTDRFYDLY